MDSRLEIAVARQDRGTHEVVRRDDLVDLGRQVAGIADAGRAAVGREVEAELFEVRQQVGLSEVFGDDARSRRERSLDVLLHRQPGLDRLLRQQPGREQHAGVRGVGARRDRSDQHVAIADRKARRGVPDDGLGVFRRGHRRLVVDHLAHRARCFGRDRRRVAIGRAALRLDRVAAVQQLSRLVESVLRRRLREQRRELALHLADLDAVLRPLGAGEARRNCAEVELDHGRVVDISGLRHAEQFLRTEVGLEILDLALASAGPSEVLDGALVDRKEAHRRAVLGRHVGDRRAIGQGERLGALAEELDELADHFLLAQDFGDGEHEVGRRDAFAQAPAELEADHVGRQKIHRLTEHAGLGLDAADAPADDADAVDHRRVAVGADERVGVVDAVGAPVHAAREVLQVHLVHDAEARRHDAEGVEGLHAPLHEFVALAIAQEFELHVEVERILGAVVVDHDRVVDDQVHRHQRLDGLRVLAHVGRHVAHRRQVGEQRHAGEVLQHDARDDERNLVDALGVGLPARELGHMLGNDLLAVAVAHHAFEDDADRHRQTIHVRIGLRELGQREELALAPRRRLEGLQRLGEVVSGSVHQHDRSLSLRCSAGLRMIMMPPSRDKHRVIRA